MQFSDMLRSRWKSEYDNLGISAAVKRTMERCLDVRDGIESKRAKIAADKDLSEAGRTKAINRFVTEQASVITKGQRDLTLAQRKLQDHKLSLTPRVTNKTDVVAAMLRQETRTMLREMKDQPAVMQLLFDVVQSGRDLIMIEAVFEAPAAFSGLDAAGAEMVLNFLLENHAAPELEAISEQSEALDLVQAAITGAMLEAQDALGMQKYSFDKWLTETAPAPNDADLAREKLTFNSAVVAVDAENLSFEDRKSLIDRMLEKQAERFMAEA
ncbi:MAG: hypothetical protein HZA66_05825 [Rhodopseudomonas palustris]|uniref:Uncharacterized protein n=1 Tax=Rhodopseudomonas palustris TaxID=1076 RepID=A0A933RX39_RHOPL|nr:hypothetical protein [Rhodopseudomonas palustris]